MRTILLTTLLSVLGVAEALGDPTVPQQIQFNRDVRPILSDNCFACHGPDEKKRKAEMRLDTEAGIRAARQAGVLVGDQPDASELIARITSKDRDEQMPPPKSGKQLSPQQIAILKAWIEQGGRWQGHWAYMPPSRSEPPPIEDATDARLSAIDRFLLAKIRVAGLEPAAAADRATLIRRLSLDLIGLPPTPEEVDAFARDSIRNSQSAIRNLVDRLLASPHFGERMAIYWLDLVRYADSVGYHKDSHRNCWLYRDYVIAAFNKNKPFDQFVLEQLAGDLMPGTTDEQLERKIASGLNRMNQTTSEGGAQAKQYLAVYAADRVRNTAAIFLGVTLGCAECHDHKFDPFTTKDFYSFATFFADLQERGVGFPKEIQMPTLESIARRQELETKLGQLGAAPQPSDELKQQMAQFEKEMKRLADAKAWPKTLITEAGKPRVMRILPRGNWLDDSGPITEPAIPAFLGKLDTGGRRATRLDLARWIVSRENPLTARVFVNRLWKLLFGEGLSRTLDDLGAQGQWPTHPELLDWLAVEFMDSGWNIKHMVRLLVMTEAYRRDSSPTAALQSRDPENRLFARQSSYRLDAELVRDSALAVSGLLTRKIGGRSVKPYQPANYWYRLYKDGKYAQDHGADLYRRGLYTYWRRSFWHPSLQAFDAPSREECVAARPRSNTPQQALVLLNDPTYVEAARVFAEQIIKDGGQTTADRLQWAFRRALARAPQTGEAQVLSDLYEEQLARYAADEPAAKKLLGVGERPVADDTNTVELAAWTAVARVVINLHEFITRN